MGLYNTTRLLSEAGEGDVQIPLDPEDAGFHSIDPLADHVGDAAGEIDPDPIIGVEEAYSIMSEAEYNWNQIMQAAGIHELAAYQSTGSEMVYEAVDIKGFFERVKTLFKNLIKRIAEVVKSWLAKVEGLVRSDGVFYNKYQSQIEEGAKKLDSKKFKLKGYHYKNLNWEARIGWNAVTANRDTGDAAAGIAAVKSGMSAVTAENKKDESGTEYTERVNKMRGASLGESSFTSGEFTSAIFKYFHGGNEKIDLKINDIKFADVTKYIGNNGTKTMKTAAKKNYRELETQVNEIIKGLNALENEFKKGTEKKDRNDDYNAKMSYVSSSIRVLKDAVNIIHAVYMGHLSALRGNHGQVHAYAMRCVGASLKPTTKVTSKSESAGIMEGVNLI